MPEESGAATYTFVDAGAQFTCAVSTSAGAQCWGDNESGQIGDGTLIDRVRAVGVSGLQSGVTALGVGAEHACVVVGGGNVKCWGNNAAGQLGDGTTVNRSAPVAVCASGSGGSCAALGDIAAVAPSDLHTCALTTPDGGVKCWGDNAFGQLGNGTTVDSLPPVDVAGLTSGVSAIAVGDRHTCALMIAGGVKCWGFNTSGQLGDGTRTSPRTSPVDVVGLSGVAALALAAEHSCARTTSGGAKCWGANWGGQLGDGSQSSRTTPVNVCASTGSPCPALSGVSQMGAGEAHTCAITSGGLKCWGWDGWGQLGDGVASFTEIQRIPKDISGLQSLLAITAGAGHTCAIFVSSPVISCWGWNGQGQLGDGTKVDRATVTGSDTDRDGCANERELQTASGSETSGGKRNPKNFWDFFDTPNDTNTTLSAKVTAGALPPFNITVAAATSFPAAPNTLFIDNEKFSYGSKTSNTFSITGRALDDTSAVQHAASALVVSNVRDRIVNSTDVSEVQARYFTNGNQNADPLLPPPPTGYHPAYDRTDDPNSTEDWDLLQGDGMIRIQDILYVSNQTDPDHNCQ